MRPGVCLGIAMASAAVVLFAGSASPQPLDCARLAAEISALDDRGQRPANHYGGAMQKQRADLNRAIRSARALGCDRASSFCSMSTPPQCPGLNAQIQQMQASLAQHAGSGDLGGNSAARQQLIARYNAYCRGQAQTPAAAAAERVFRNAFRGLHAQSRPVRATAPDRTGASARGRRPAAARRFAGGLRAQLRRRFFPAHPIGDGKAIRIS